MKPNKAFLGTLLLGLTMVAAPLAGAHASAAGSAATGAQTTMQLVATAYGPSLQDNYPYGAVDYYGQPLVSGDVAVDPSVIPLGTRLYITGYQSPYLPAGGFYAVARDTGGAIKGGRVDIYINGSHAQVLSFGIQKVQVTILGPGAGTTGQTQAAPAVQTSTDSASPAPVTAPASKWAFPFHTTQWWQGLDWHL